VFGIDFGTSNSAIAELGGDGEVRLAKWRVPEQLARTAGLKGESDTIPTVIFAPEYDNLLHTGHEAIAHYLFTGLEGRFMQSIKAFLPQETFKGTMIRGRTYSIEDLVAIFLRKLLDGAEAQFGKSIRKGRVVLGRPARFSLDPEEDALAEARLIKAAQTAGLEHFTFLIEPIAAALAYEATLTSDETVLVVDLGGGTSDFTLMRVGPSHRGERDRRTSILASGGVPVAGDALDGEIVRSQLFDVLGWGSNYRAFGEKTPVPHWIWQKLKRWNHVSFLKGKKYLDFLREVHETSDRPKEIASLIRIVDEDMGYLLFRSVERAKRGVAEKKESRIADKENDLPVDEKMTRAEFERSVAGLIGDIEKMAMATVEKSGAKVSEVDAVFMTGGTSLIPCVQQAFARVFGQEKLRARSTFTSVVDGLARGAVWE
jgi:hypothetical chaperone protein